MKLGENFHLIRQFISNKFHEDLRKIVNFLLMANFWKCVVFLHRPYFTHIKLISFIDFSSCRRWIYRWVRASLPIQAGLLVLLGVLSFAPIAIWKEEVLCTVQNNFRDSIEPMMTWNNGPPPTWYVPKLTMPKYFDLNWILCWKNI